LGKEETVLWDGSDKLKEESKNMKNKILGIFVCMLLIATLVSAGKSLQNNLGNATNPNNLQSISSGDWIEKQKLLASDGETQDYFGGSISINGDTALIGAYDENVGRGAVYVFTRTDATTWAEQAKLTASDGTISDLFGCSVSLFGDIALIGASRDDDAGQMSGSAYVFIRNGTTWTQQQKLLASDGAATDSFGCSVSLFGDTALIGAYGMGGSAYVFTRTGSSWIQQTKLTAPGGTIMNAFGWSVSLDGDTALIGDIHDDGNAENTGATYVFTCTGTTWTQQQKLLASDGATDDVFGSDVSLSADTALIGAYGDDDNGADSGSAYVFVRTGTTWAQQQKLLTSDGAADDQFSRGSVSLDGDTALIGAWNDDDYGVDSGSAYVFTRNGTTWTQQQKLFAVDGVADDFFGCSVSLSANVALIGAALDDDNGFNSGSAYVFTKVVVPVLDLIHIKGGLLGISVVLKNFGNGIADNISWEMSASGGLFYPRTKNGTIDPLSPGQNETIHIRPMLGLGTATITFFCKYRIVNFTYDVDFIVKQEWHNRALFFLFSFPERIQPTKQWMTIENYSYINTSDFSGVEFHYLQKTNMHNVRVVVNSPSFAQQIEFLAACKFTNGTAILNECWITKELIQGGDAHWEVELVDGG
jgi:hypothetical protein